MADTDLLGGDNYLVAVCGKGINMAKLKIWNVKYHLEWVERTCDEMLNRDGKHPEGGLRLAPIDRDNLRAMWFMTRAILRQHAAKGTRKDVYVNTK